MEIKEKKQCAIKRQHKLSVCDVRGGRAQELEKEILAFIDYKNVEIKKTKAGIYKAKSKALFDESYRGLVTELYAIKSKLQEEKTRTLQQMYAVLRDLSCTHYVEVDNIVPTVGRAVLAKWITGDNTYDADDGANYGSVGTDNTTPANGDTTLGAESFRKATSSVAQSNNVAILTNFYSAADFTGTIEEAGWHIAGTGTTDSGQLLSHFLTGTTTKSSIESLTVESTFTIT